MDAATAYRRRWFTLITLCLSLMVIGLDNTILNVALPTLVKDLDASTSQLQWIVDSYVLVFAGLLLTAGSLGDRFGRRRALTVGLAVFGLGSALSAFAGSSTQLIATRALMGVGGAFIMPSTLSILTNVFTEPKERAKAIGIWAGVSGVGIAIGPVVGGWLLEHFSWHSVFTVNIPVVLGALALGRFFIPESFDPSAPRLDPVGAVLSMAGLSSLLYAIIGAPEHGWGSTHSLMFFGLGAAVLLGFVAWELHTDHPMLDVRFFENPRFTAASTSVTLVFFALFGSLFFMTQYLQFVLGYTALQAGVRVIPQALMLMVSAPLSAKLVERVGTKVVVVFGLVVVATGLLIAAQASDTSGYEIVLASMVVLGAGMGLTMAPATESIMGSLPRDKAGVGSAVNDTTRQVGGALGVAVLGSLLSSSYGRSIDAAVAGQSVPAPVVGALKSSIGAANQVADQVGGPAGRLLSTAAHHGFIHAMDETLLIGACVAALGALVSLLFLPARAADAESAAVATTALEDGGALAVEGAAA